MDSAILKMLKNRGRSGSLRGDEISISAADLISIHLCDHNNIITTFGCEDWRFAIFIFYSD